MIEHKGYIASVEYDDSVDELYAYVANSGAYPIASCYAKDVEGLRREFRISIDQYLTLCQERGITAQKPFSGKINLRLGSALHQSATQASKAAGTSLNAWIIQTIEEKVAG